MNGEQTTLPLTSCLPAQAEQQVAAVESPLRGHETSVLPHLDADTSWVFCRGSSGQGVEACALSRVGLTKAVNQDGASLHVKEGNTLVLGVFDGVTNCEGIQAERLRDKIQADLAELVSSGEGAPMQWLKQLHREARSWLQRVAPDANAGVAATILELHADGLCRWASAGDVLIHAAHRSRRLFSRHSNLRVMQLNAAAVDSDRQMLLASIGQSRPLRIEAGVTRVGLQDMVIVTTDGATLSMPEFERLLAGCPRRDTEELEALARRIDRHALLRGSEDDRTVALLRRFEGALP